MTLKRIARTIFVPILAFSFFVESICPAYALSSSELASHFSSHPLNWAQIKIPKELGRLEVVGIPDKNSGRDGRRPFVVYVQDAHGLIDAQKNIARIIGYLNQKYQINYVGVEGSVGALEPIVLRSFPEKQVLQKKLAEYLLRGEFSGAEFALITSENTLTGFGLENPSLYAANQDAYQKSLSMREKALSEIGRLRKVLDERRKIEFSEALSLFFEKVRAYEEEKIGLAEFSEILKMFWTIEEVQKNYPHVADLWKAFPDEKGGQESLDEGVKKLAAEFRNKFSRRLGVEEWKKYNLRAQEYQTGVITAGNYLEYLQGMGEKIGVRPRLNLPMRKVLKQAESLERIQGSVLISELEALKSKTLGWIARTDKERKLLREYEKLKLLESMVKLELSKEDYREAEKTFTEEAFDALNVVFKPSKTFYEKAVERDDAFHQIISRTLEEKNVRSVVVVAGGFHRDGFEKWAQKEGLGYAVVSPRIKSLEGRNNYAKVMAGDVSYKKYFTGDYFTAFHQHAAHGLIRELSGSSIKKTLKAWRDEILRELAAQKKLGTAWGYTRYVDTEIKVNAERLGINGHKALDKTWMREAVAAELDKFRHEWTGKLWSQFEEEFGAFKRRFSALVGGGGGPLHEGDIQALLSLSRLAAPGVLSPDNRSNTTASSSRSEVRDGGSSGMGIKNLDIEFLSSDQRGVPNRRSAMSAVTSGLVDGEEFVIKFPYGFLSGERRLHGFENNDVEVLIRDGVILAREMKAIRAMEIAGVLPKGAFSVQLDYGQWVGRVKKQFGQFPKKGFRKERKRWREFLNKSKKRGYFQALFLPRISGVTFENWVKDLKKEEKTPRMKFDQWSRTFEAVIDSILKYRREGWMHNDLADSEILTAKAKEGDAGSVRISGIVDWGSAINLSEAKNLEAVLPNGDKISSIKKMYAEFFNQSSMVFQSFRPLFPWIDVAGVLLSMEQHLSLLFLKEANKDPSLTHLINKMMLYIFRYKVFIADYVRENPDFETGFKAANTMLEELKNMFTDNSKKAGKKNRGKRLPSDNVVLDANVSRSEARSDNAGIDLSNFSVSKPHDVEAVIMEIINRKKAAKRGARNTVNVEPLIHFQPFEVRNALENLDADQTDLKKDLDWVLNQYIGLLTKDLKRGELENCPIDQNFSGQVHVKMVDRGSGFGNLSAMAKVIDGLMQRMPNAEFIVFTGSYLREVGNFLKNSLEDKRIQLQMKFFDEKSNGKGILSIYVGSMGNSLEINHSDSILLAQGTTEWNVVIPIQASGARLKEGLKINFERKTNDFSLQTFNLIPLFLGGTDGGIIKTPGIQEKVLTIQQTSMSGISTMRRQLFQDIMNERMADKTKLLVLDESVYDGPWVLAYYQNAGVFLRYVEALAKVASVKNPVLVLAIPGDANGRINKSPVYPFIDEKLQALQKEDSKFTKKLRIISLDEGVNPDTFQRILLLTGSPDTEKSGLRSIFPNLLTGDQSIAEAIQAGKLFLPDFKSGPFFDSLKLSAVPGWNEIVKGELRKAPPGKRNSYLPIVQQLFEIRGKILDVVQETRNSYKWTNNNPDVNQMAIYQRDIWEFLGKPDVFFRESYVSILAEVISNGMKETDSFLKIWERALNVAQTKTPDIADLILTTFAHSARSEVRRGDYQFTKSYSGWMDSLTEGDKILVDQIISGTLPENLPERVFIAQWFDEWESRYEGRTAYLVLEEPMKIGGREIFSLRLKGVLPVVGPDGKLTLYSGNGFVPRELVVDENGAIGKEKKAPRKFVGSVPYDEVLREYEVLERSEDEMLQLDFPLAVGTYSFLSSGDDRQGFVVMGMEKSWGSEDISSQSGDIRFRLEAPDDFDDNKHGINPGGKGKELNLSDNGVLGARGRIIGEEDSKKYYTLLGKKLREYHEKIGFHRYPHTGNIGAGKGGSIVLRDLGTTVFRKELSGTHQQVKQQEISWRFLDIGRIWFDLVEIYQKAVYLDGLDDIYWFNGKRLLPFFLQGYFPAWSSSDISEFIGNPSLESIIDRFLRLELGDEKLLLSENHSILGPLVSKITDVVEEAKTPPHPARSEVRRRMNVLNVFLGESIARGMVQRRSLGESYPKILNQLELMAQARRKEIDEKLREAFTRWVDKILAQDATASSLALEALEAEFGFLPDSLKKEVAFFAEALLFRIYLYGPDNVLPQNNSSKLIAGKNIKALISKAVRDPRKFREVLEEMLHTSEFESWRTRYLGQEIRTGKMHREEIGHDFLVLDLALVDISSPKKIEEFSQSIESLSKRYAKIGLIFPKGERVEELKKFLPKEISLIQYGENRAAGLSRLGVSPGQNGLAMVGSGTLVAVPEGFSGQRIVTTATVVSRAGGVEKVAQLMDLMAGEPYLWKLLEKKGERFFELTDKSLTAVGEFLGILNALFKAQQRVSVAA